LIHEDAFDEWSLKAYHNPRLARLFYELIAEWQSLYDFLQQLALAEEKPSKKNLKKASEHFKSPTDFIEYIDTWATSVKEALEENGSAQVIKERLADVACLYKWQNKRKLPALIATEIAQFEEPLHEKRFLMQLIRRSALYAIEDFCEGNEDKMKFFIRFVHLLDQTWGYMPVLHD